ncbi:hypothetical protein M426DRAFT_316536 [Hypoxylon sp. CI-4A]|nr:hypothetical protein M426DRAFT_316536 [Hypoxylon sp. CI-4A]
MESWFKDVGKPALLDALTGVCDRIGNELDAEIQSHRNENKQLASEIENLRGKVSNVDRLEEETRSLKKEIQNLKDQSKNSDNTKEYRTPLAPRSVNQVTNPKRSTQSSKINLDKSKPSELKEEYLKLDGNYTKLRDRYTELQDAHTKLNQRLRDMTSAYNQWRDHAGQLDERCQKRNRTIKKLEARLEAAAAAASAPLDASFSTDTHRPPGIERGWAVSESAHHNAPGPEDPTWPPALDGDEERESLRTTVSASPNLTRTLNQRRTTENGVTPGLVSRTSSTQEDSGDSTLPPLPQNQEVPSVVFIKNEPSSDTPVVVSERSLRKRKHDGDAAESLVPARIKAEDGSDPLITGEHLHFEPHESIDFDVEGGRVSTPRKRIKTIIANGGLLISDITERSQSPTSDSRSGGQDGTMRGLVGRDKNDESAENTEPSHKHQGDRSSALTPLNRNIIQRRPETSYVKKRASSPQRISVLAEDGDCGETPRAVTEKRPKSGRLSNLLNGSPMYDAASPSLSNHVNRIRPLRLSEIEMPERRELPWNKPRSKKLDEAAHPTTLETLNTKRTSTNNSTKRTYDDRATGSVAKSTRPLRERPKSELGINDFKVNPTVNEGYDYAFTDVVRGKSERAGLVGCVQEGCCGETFRLQARAQRPQTGPSDFQVLLEKHLGDEAWKLSTMAKEEKEELWVEAKMRELADAHGRHRHRFHRAASPVGFWRVEFPSTQEEMQDKEQAAKMSRQIVEDRYREAMRPGGRWLFRDE